MNAETERKWMQLYMIEDLGRMTRKYTGDYSKIMETQEKRVRRLMKIASHHSFYQRRFKEAGIDPEEIVRLTRSDKKAEAGNVKFILLKRIGKAVIDSTVTEEEILAAVKEIYYNEEEMASE